MNYFYPEHSGRNRCKSVGTIGGNGKVYRNHYAKCTSFLLKSECVTTYQVANPHV